MGMERIAIHGGRIISVHKENDGCCTHGCPIHHPTDPHKDWPLVWRDDRYLFERLCPHGVGHPDLDSLNYLERMGKNFTHESAHGCDGCCRSHGDIVWHEGRPKA